MRKPVLLLKGGRTRKGAQAAASHTASMAVNDRVLRGAIRQAGVLRMGDIDELKETIQGFQCMPFPRGRRLALVTYSGAQAIMSIDEAIDRGLELSSFKSETRAELGKVIPTPSKTRNPVDLFPDMMVHGFTETTTVIFRALLKDDGVHGIIFINLAPSSPASLRPLVDLIRNRLTKPVLFSLIGHAEDVEGCKGFLEGHRIPFYHLPEKAVRVFSNMWRYSKAAKRV